MTWHDGKPFTADDVVFNWEYASDPATAAITIGSYKDVKVEKVDDYTVTRAVRQADAVLGRRLRRRARHDHSQASVRRLHRRASRATRPTNLKPVGTGPYQFVDFKPGDMVRGRDQSQLPHAPTGRTSTRSR